MYIYMYRKKKKIKQAVSKETPTFRPCGLPRDGGGGGEGWGGERGEGEAGLGVGEGGGGEGAMTDR